MVARWGKGCGEKRNRCKMEKGRCEVEKRTSGQGKSEISGKKKTTRDLFNGSLVFVSGGKRFRCAVALAAG